jgi:RNA-directed DNA polymerase
MLSRVWEVDAAGGWDESMRSYPGRSDGYASEIVFQGGNLRSDARLNRQKSAEAIVGERIDTRTKGPNIKSHRNDLIRETGEERGYPTEVGLGRWGPGEAREEASESGVCIRQREGEMTRRNGITVELLEEIVSGDNMKAALKRVKANKGSHGVDGMKVDELPTYLATEWPTIRQSLLDGTYVPKPVRRVEIPKPDGGMRLLGIPIVLDRLIEQAMAQKLSAVFEPGFSRHSYGFRPGKRAHDAIRAAREFIQEGYVWVVDIDLEKFFDQVNHDKLMARVARKVKDKRVLKLIRRYLESGVLINGVKIASDEGTPQGGPLSPLLANIMLDDLDKELERRGHRFCRYADDCNIYVKSKRAGERVMASVSNYIRKRLSLKINEGKSAVDRPGKRKFLGFSFYRRKERIGIRIHPKSVKRFKDKVRDITNKNVGMSMEERLRRLNLLTVGWINYFGLADAKYMMKELDEWIRRRLRACHWKQWKRIGTKHDNLVRLGVHDSKAWEWANSRKGYWRIAGSWVLSTSLTNDCLEKIGFKSLVKHYSGITYSW